MYGDRTWFSTFWRGLLLLALMLAFAIIALAGLLILDRLAWIPPIKPDTLADFSFDAASSFALRHQWEALWTMGTLLALTGLVIWGALAPAHRWLFRFSVTRYIGERGIFWRQTAWATALVFPAFLLTMAWATAGTERVLFAWVASAPLVALTLALVLPLQCLAEEVLFRGFLQSWFGRLLPGFVLACLAQAILFGLLHPGQFLASFSMGVALGMATRFFGTLALPFIFHLANNVTVIAAGPTPLWLGRPLPGWDINPPLGLPLMVLFSSILMVAICVASAHQERRANAA